MSRTSSVDAPALGNGRAAVPPDNMVAGARRSAARVNVARLTLWVVAGLTLLAFGLRIYWLDGQSMWSDEGLSLYRASQSLGNILANTIVVDGVVTRDTTPPTYFLLLAAWRAVAGDSIYALRFLSAAFGVLAVPLMFVLGRRLFSPLVGALAALLMAVSPFHIFYSQELRNYSLFVTLSLVSVWLTWRLRGAARWHRRRLGLGWLVAAVALAYTHYFGLFILAFEVLALIVMALRGRATRRVWLLVGLAALAALPLIPFGLAQLRAGPQFDFEHLPVVRVLHEALTAYSLGMVKEVTLPWAQLWPYALLLLPAMWLWGRAPRTRPPLVFSLGWLIVPLALLLLVSQITPIYNGPRHILFGLPPFLMLIAASLGGLRGWWRLLILPALALALIPQSERVHAQFFSLVKDDARGAALYISQRATASDVVVLHDALMQFTFLPYYDGAAPVVTVPRYASGDVAAAQAELARLAASHGRLWFVQEPAPRDGFPQTALPEWAKQNLFQAATTDFGSLWLGSRVDEYRSAPPITDVLPTPATLLDRRWESGIRLHGYQVRRGTTIGEPLEMTLYWSVDTPQAIEPRLKVALVDPAGREWWAADHGFYDGLPVRRWPTDRIIAQDYSFELPPGLAPGDYRLHLQFRDEADAALPPQDQQPAPGWVDGPPLSLVRPTTPVALPAVAGRAETMVHFDGLDLVAVDQPITPIRPGSAWQGVLYWRARQPLAADAQVKAQLVDGRGAILAEDIVPPSRADFPTSVWQAGDLVRTPLRLDVPSNALGNDYRLRVGLVDGQGAPIAASAGWWPARRDMVDVARVEVAPWPLETRAPEMEHPLDAVFGPIRLRGYNLTGQAVPGKDLSLTLVWQAAEQPTENLKVFAHLLDESGKPVAQSDGIPVDGARPTDGWRPSEVVQDERRVRLPTALPAGTYGLGVGLYRADTGQRVPVTRDGQPQPDDILTLDTEVRVKAR